jgi:CheY-like chemotaxis protein
MSTILIVDDEPIIRQLAERILEHDGHTMLTAGNGREALEVMREKTPDLVLLDLQMPQMDGMTFLKLMRGNRDWAEVPVVIMSALADKTNVAQAGHLGVRDYLLKAGFSLKQMRTRLGKYLDAPVTPAGAEKPVNVPADAMLVE